METQDGGRNFSNGVINEEDFFEREPLTQEENMQWAKQAKRGNSPDGYYSGYGEAASTETPMPNELVFKVKLTEDEFQMYLRERMSRGLAV
jgi:hypothetical protein